MSPYVYQAIFSIHKLIMHFSSSKSEALQIASGLGYSGCVSRGLGNL